MNVILNIPGNVLQLHQQGLLERAFHDGLFPGLLFRGEALAEEFPANSGVEMWQTRPGLLAPVTTPLPAGQDPIPQAIAYEQWPVRLERYANTVDTHMPTSVTANSDLFLRNIHQLGLNAGQSLNRLPRNALFKAYLQGQTNSITAALTSDTTLRVAALSGFRDIVLPASTVRPADVSASSPLPITIYNATPITANVVGTQPDDPTDPNGPGTLILSAALGAAVPARTPVVSAYAPRVVRSGGGRSVDSISASDTLTLQDIITATSVLRAANVPPHDDGFYHCHIPPEGEAQFFIDPAIQRLYQGRPDDVAFKMGFVGQIGGNRMWLNNECPSVLTSGALTSTGTLAKYSRDIAAETVNEAGVRIARAIVTGKGSIYEKWFDETQFVTEAGLNGKIGEFTVVNSNLKVTVDRVRLILRAPMDRLQDQVAASWSYMGDFPIPSDVTGASGPERYKRALVIEFAGM